MSIKFIMKGKRGNYRVLALDNSGTFTTIGDFTNKERARGVQYFLEANPHYLLAKETHESRQKLIELFAKREGEFIELLARNSGLSDYVKNIKAQRDKFLKVLRITAKSSLSASEVHDAQDAIAGHEDIIL